MPQFLTRRRLAREELVALIGIAGVVVALALNGANLIDPPRWALFTIVALSAVVAISSLLVNLRTQRDDREAHWQQSLALSTKGMSLPAVRAVDSYDIGVSVSKYIERSGHRPPYIPRDLDKAIDRRLSDSSFVVIVGDAKVGKSRTAYEAMLRNYPDRQIIVPKVGSGLFEELVRPDAVQQWGPEGAVLWLDDLDRYLIGTGGLDLAILDGLEGIRMPLKVVATMTALRRGELEATSDEIGRVARLVLRRAEQLWLEAQPSPQELAAAAELYPGEDFQNGIGEELVAGSVLVRKYQDGRATSPTGRAIVDAAIDWRRAGIVRPINETELRQLFQLYLKRLRSDLDANDDAFALGLSWARGPVASHVALLTRIPDEATSLFEPLDYGVPA